MIDFHNKIIFLHIPKTGGTAIESYFATIRGISCQDLAPLGVFINSKKSVLERQNTHNSLFMIEQYIFGGGIPEEYEIFTVVRHPLSRFISEVRSRRLPPPRWSPIHVRVPPWMMLYFMKNPYHRLKDLNCHLRPQATFLEGAARDRVKVLRFETLSNDFNCLQKKLQLPELPLPIANASSGRIPQPPKRVIDQVVDFYKADFELFGYT